MISTRNIVLSAAGFAALAQAVTVNTPASAVQCQPVQLSWSQGTAPFYVSIIPGGQPSAAALENIPTQNGNSYTWMVDLSAGTSITVKVVDSTGDTNYSDQITIQQGTTTDCAASSGSGAAAAGSPAGSSASSAAGGAASSASSAAARVTSSAGAALSSGRNAVSSAASSAASGINAAAAAATSPSSGASSTAKVGMSLVAGAAAVFALVA